MNYDIIGFSKHYNFDDIDGFLTYYHINVSIDEAPYCIVVDEETMYFIGDDRVTANRKEFRDAVEEFLKLNADIPLLKEIQEIVRRKRVDLLF
ncbi:hypothetical protein [Neobacillus soli]|uniref:hypothetical protein n=1 Tax=Neobacillus soli TaxID=220688 RepID=UPI000826D205|nr:hypothetical protein [Neobacillus soli]